MKIGFIGLGTMGEPMCANLIKKSTQQVLVFNRTRKKALRLIDIGGVLADSIEEIGSKSDLIFSMVTNSQDVLAVYEELLKVARNGQIFVDMSTIDPKVSLKISKRVAEKGAMMLEAPVVKSRPAAINGTLGIYVGGDYQTYLKIKDILLMMGSNILYMGNYGKGLAMKICHNILVAQIQNGVNEMITVAQKCGIGIDDFTTAISFGGGQNLYLDSKSNAIRENNFIPAFTIENMYKDITIGKSFIQELGLDLQGLNLVLDVYKKAMESTLGKEDFSATYKVVNHQN